MVSLAWLCLFTAMFGQLYAGDFVGKVKVLYNVFTVIEGDRFEMRCSATHEDRRPTLEWYFIDYQNRRTNLTQPKSDGTGNSATSEFSRNSARIADTGDYFCVAQVRDIDNILDFKTSSGIPIQVIKKENEPRVAITTSRVRGGEAVLTCKVVPQGIGHLTWLHDGSRVKTEKLVSQLELDVASGGEYECHGNLTLGGYKYFISRAFVNAAVGFTHTTTQTTILAAILFCFVTFLNL